jgi:alpha-mannosidase
MKQQYHVDDFIRPETIQNKPLSAVSGSARKKLCGYLIVSALVLPLWLDAHAQTTQTPDISKTPTLFVVPYAHLDTQWRWEFPQVISEYLLKTMRVNFDYMDKYPHYVFNWTGSNRYMLMKEYYPGDYARIKQYVARGQWFPAGSSVEEGDVNLPDAEGIFRQILYGNTYFRHEFGKASNEYMLPDCFGFPASLPSILAHAGIKGFSTQKLNATWQPAPKVGGPDSPEQTPEGIPFNVGVWTGPDGKSVIAALNPGGYTGTAFTDLSKNPGPPPPRPPLTDQQRAQLTPQQLAAQQRPRQWEQNWVKRIDLDGKLTGVFADYHYVGTGDIGGAPPEASVKLLEATVTQGETVLPPPPPAGSANPPGTPGTLPPGSGPKVKVGDGPVHVLMSAADQMFNAIRPDMTARLPQYKGDLELINHSAGSLTSQAYHKQQVIKNGNLADAAEKASLAADWMGGLPYQQERLNGAWRLELAGHFHDSAAGTATPRAYEYIWNDDTIATNQFATVLTSASAAVASGLDTQARGTPIVVYNPLNIAREDLVEASIAFARATPKAVRVYGPDGKEMPAQLNGHKVLFSAKVPSVGYAVYDVVPADNQAAGGELKVTASSLENARYRVQLDEAGDVSSIFDKGLNKELLSAPIRLAISNDAPRIYPAWNMEFDQEQAVPRAYVSGPAQIRIKETGPIRVSIEVSRDTENSRFVQTISLSAGDAGNRVEFANSIDWRTLSANLKAAIPLAASNTNATYNWDIGTIERPNAQMRQFEVASHRWIDLTDKSGSFGTTILTDCKNGSDKPSDNTVRLTLMRSPGVLPENGRPSPYTDQANQDWGHHEFVFALIGHAGDWRQAQTDWQAYRLNDPLIAFETTHHSGSLGKNFSLMKVSDSRIRVLALKKAEDSNEIVLRMVELDGKNASNVKVSFAGQLTAAREINAQEQPIGNADVSGGALTTSFTAYQPRTYALRLGTPAVKLTATHSQPVQLNYDLLVANNDDSKTAGDGMDGKGNTLPAEMLPAKIEYNGVGFQLAPAAGKPNAVIAKGQQIALPSGSFNRVYIVAASAKGDQNASFRIGDRSASLNIEAWDGFIGQWDKRVWKDQTERDWATSAHNTVWPAADMVQREGHPPSPRYPENYVGLQPGYIKPASLAWFASHHHTREGLNEPYQYSYLFAYSVDLPKGARTLTLPNNESVRILAISVADDDPELKPVTPLYDTLGRTEPAQEMEQAKF